MNIENDGRVMADFIGNAVRRENITLNSAGTALRSFIYINDTVTGIFAALLNGGRNEVYNLANEKEEISVLDLAKAIAATRSLSVSHVELTEEQRRNYTAFKRVAMSTARIEQLGWSPAVDIATGTRRTIESFG